MHFWVMTAVVAWATGCGEVANSTENSDRYPLIAARTEDPTAALFRLFANDSMPGDSAIRCLKSGVLLSTQPGAHYSLFVENGGEDLELNLFELVGSEVKTSPVIQSGKCDGHGCSFELVGRGKMVRWWIAAVSTPDGEPIEQPIQSVKFGGENRPRDTLDLNILFLGKLTDLESTEAQQRFAEEMRQTIALLYRPAAIEVVLRNALPGSSHPHAPLAVQLDSTAQFRFRPDLWQLEWGEGGMKTLPLDQLSEGWRGEAAQALQIAVVEWIDDIGYIGVAPLYGLNLGEGSASTAVVAMQTYNDQWELKRNDHQLLYETIAHEIAHFLGLRHTTATPEDQLMMGDRSVVEDGLSDTPFDPLCSVALSKRSSRLYPPSFFPAPPFFSRRFASAERENNRCPDAGNLLFPLAIDGVEQTTLTPSQGALMRANLHLLSR